MESSSLISKLFERDLYGWSLRLVKKRTHQIDFGIVDSKVAPTHYQYRQLSDLAMVL